ncbi:14136_t:CDS:2, partial [Gigaspora margarita]
FGKASTEIVTKIKYHLEFEENPETSKDGVVCIYNVTGMDPEKALEIFDLKNIHIKMCQFAASELLTMTHMSLNFENNLFKKIFDANELSFDTNTKNTFAAVHKTLYGFIHSCTRIQCDSKPKLEQLSDDTSEPNYFIGCEKFKNSECGY